MRILLDECLPTRLKAELPGHEAVVVRRMGWSGRKNGELLRLAEKSFDVFLTVDRNLRHQQHLRNFNISVILLIASSNEIDTLRPLMPRVRFAIRNAKHGQLIIIRS